MPTVDHSGRFHARGVCTDKDSRGALGFPIKASTLKAARNFASREILEMLPGWNRGTGVMFKDGKRVESYRLIRGELGE